MQPYLMELMLEERRREIDRELAKQQLLRSLQKTRTPRRPLRIAGCRVGRLLIVWGEKLQRYGDGAIVTQPSQLQRG